MTGQDRHFDHIPDDPIEQALRNARAGQETSPPRATMPHGYMPPDHLEPCQRCRGTGRAYGGPCFKCQGKGKVAFKSSSAERQIKREKARERKTSNLAADIETFKTGYPAVYSWLNGNTWEFAQKMWEALHHYGSLTDNQLAACQKCVAKRAENQAERKTREESAPEVSIAKIEEAFDNASQNLKWPKLTLGDFTFKPAGPTSKNPGAVYVTEGTEYLGKIMNGKLMTVRSCGDTREQKIIEACQDPEGAAIAHGKLTGACACCGRALSDPESVERGIGPVCAEHYGW